MRSLREDQTEALNNLRAAVGEGDRHIVMQAPTGYGKTVLSAELVNRARMKDKKVLFIVPAISLIDQTVEMFNGQGISDIGVIQQNHRQTDGCMPVQVASVQTLQRREMPPADVVVIDEVHRWSDAYGTWMQTPGVWWEKPVIGLSATPWHKVLGTYFKRLIKASTTQELIDKGLLSDFKVYASSHPDLDGVRTVQGDYEKGELSRRMSKVKLVADIIETWIEQGRGRSTLCFAVDRTHAKKLHEQFEARGVRTAYQDAFTTPNGRAEIKRGFHDGSIEVVVNIGTLTMGIDWDVRCIILARPTKSEMLFVQIMGRGLRTAPGKDFLLVLDHTSTHSNLGFVTDIDVNHTELLADTDRVASVTDRIRLPKECPACGFLKAPGMSKCPMCQHVTVAHCTIEQTPGELKEIERKKKEERASIDRRVFYAELLAYAQLKGWKPGWAANVYRERFEVWPNAMKDVRAAPAISRDTKNWITHRNIAWVRGKGRNARWPIAKED